MNVNQDTPAHPVALRCISRFAAAVLVALALTSLTACGNANNNAKEEKTTTTEQPPEKDGVKLSKDEAQRAGIALEEVKAHTLGEAITVTATIRANQDRMARVAPRVEGRLATVVVSLGDAVRPNQLLATLDSVAVGEASSALIQAQSIDRLAQADFQRAASLQAEEIISQKDYLRARSEYERSKASVRAAEDRLKLLGVSSSHAGQATSIFPLISPISGTVIEKKATVGGLAGPTDSLFLIADLSRVWIEADLAESQLSKVRVGANASVIVDAYPRESFKGQVTYVANVLDKDTRTIPARIEVDNKDGRLKPEMFATATIESPTAATATEREVLTVPAGAIVLMQGQPSVFVFENDGYEQRAIDIGERLGDRTVVKSGLQSGEQVVSAGAYALKARVLKSQIGDAH